MGKRARTVSLLLAGLMVLCAAANAQSLRNDAAREEAFMDWGFGVFIHWSFDSQLGTVISHSMVGANDKYLDRFINELPKTFDPDRYDPDAWVKLFKLAGAKYVVFTTKHHSGFCMWDTATTDFNIMNTPHNKDIVAPLVAACRKNGLKVGFYFSPEDFWFLRKQGKTIRRRADYALPGNNPGLLAHDRAQMKELLTRYGPIDMVFLDGAQTDDHPIVQYVHELQPECLVTRGEMETPEQRIPEAPLPGPWEACFTLGTQWHFKPTNEEYKSGTELIEMLISVRAKGGNLLLNIGPEPNGAIPFEQERRLRELAIWMFVNDEAIHGIRPCPVIREGDVWYTQSRDGKSIYAFLTKQGLWPRGERRSFRLERLEAKRGASVAVLGQNDIVVEYKPDNDPTPTLKRTEKGIEISVVRAQRLYNNHKWPNPIVVKLTNVKFSD